MSTAPHQPKQRLSRTEAIATIADLDAKLERVTTRREEVRAEILASDPSLDQAQLPDIRSRVETVKLNLKALAAELTSARNNTSSPPDQATLDTLIDRIRFARTVIGGLERKISELARLEELDKIIAGYTTKLDEAGAALHEVIPSEQPLSERVLTAEAKYKQAIAERQTEEAAAADLYSIKAVQAFEEKVLPTWQRVEKFLADRSLAHERGEELAFKKFVVLDENTLKGVKETFDRFPQVPAVVGRADAVNTALVGYAEAYTTYEDSVKTGERIQIGRATRKLYAAIERIEALPPLEAGFVAPYKKAYAAEMERIERQHAASISAAEAELFAAIPPADREELVLARMENVAPAPASEHPIFKKLETPEGQKEQVDAILKQLGIPLTVDGLKDFKAKMVAELRGNGIVDDGTKKSRKINNFDKDIWIALKQDLALELTSDTIKPQQCKESIQARLKRTRLQEPNQHLVEVLAEAINPEKSTEDAMIDLRVAIETYVDALPAVAAESDDAKKAPLLQAALSKLDPLREQFKKLVMGETQAAQVAAGVTDANLLRRSKREYGEVFAKAIGPVAVPVVTAAKDPRIAAKASVDQFVASMERTAVLATEEKNLLAVQGKVVDAAAAGRGALNALETSRTDLTAHKAEVERIKGEKARINAEAGPRRLTLAKEWAEEHKKHLDEYGRIAKTKEEDFTKAKKELDEVAKEVTKGFKTVEALADEVTSTKRLLRRLESGVVFYNGTTDPFERSLLHQLKNVKANNITYPTGLDLLEHIVRERDEAPLKKGLGEDKWLPPALLTMTRKLFRDPRYSMDTRIEHAYEVAKHETEPLLAATNWFVAHRLNPALVGKDPSSWMPWAKATWKKKFGGKDQNKAGSSQELVDHARAIRTNLAEIFGTAQAAYEQAEADEERAIRSGANALIIGQARRKREQLLAERDYYQTPFRRLEDALRNPNTVEMEAFYEVCFSALQVATKGRTGKDILKKDEPYSFDAFKRLETHLEEVATPPKQANLDAIKEVLRIDEDRSQALLRAVPDLTKSFQDDIRTGLAKKDELLERLNQKLDAKEAAEREASTANARLTEEKGKLVKTALDAFDAQVVAEVAAVDPDNAASKLPELEGRVTKAEQEVAAAKKVFEQSLDELATAYGVWLEKRTSVLKPIDEQTTQSERTVSRRLKEEEEAMFQAFKDQGAPDTGRRADFDKWYKGLGKPQKTALLQAIAPALYLTP